MSAQAQVAQHTGISFMVVHNGAKCAPLLVQRENFIGKIGIAAASKVYQKAYTPDEFPNAKRVASDDPL